MRLRQVFAWLGLADVGGSGRPDLRRNGPELEVDRLEVQLDEASLSARGRLPAWPTLAGAHLDLALAGPRLQDFSTAAEANNA